MWFLKNCLQLSEGHAFGLEGPGHLSSGARGPHPLGQAGPPGRGEGVLPPRSCLAGSSDAGPRGSKHLPPRRPRKSPRLAAAARGPTPRVARARSGRERCFSPPRPLRSSVCQSVHSRPRVPTGGASVGAGPLRPSKSWPTSRFALTRPARDVQLPRRR